LVDLREASSIANSMRRILESDLSEPDKAFAVRDFNSDLDEETLMAVWSFLRRDSAMRRRWKDYLSMAQHGRME
jgi:hypothetical protein